MLAIGPDPRWKSLWRTLRSWDPQPVPEPELDPQLGTYSGLERAAEILRYRLHRLEYVLSPCGMLREWLKLGLRIFLVLSVPALFVLPALVMLFYGIVELTALALRVCVNVLQILLAILGIVVVGGLLISMLGSRRK